MPRRRAGVLFARGDRFAWSVEGTLRLGYGVNTYSWDEVDYGGFYGGLDLSLVLSL
ncbi:MAG: hypothetical protein ACOCXM_10505 [Myxococcota bacterium]